MWIICYPSRPVFFHWDHKIHKSPKWLSGPLSHYCYTWVVYEEYKEQFHVLNMGKCLQFSWDDPKLLGSSKSFVCNKFERAHLLSIVSRAGSVRPLCTVRRRSSFLSACSNASRINNKAIYPRLRWKIMKVLIAQYPFSLVRMKYWDLLDQCPWGNIRPTNRHDSFQYYTTV